MLPATVTAQEFAALPPTDQAHFVKLDNGTFRADIKPSGGLALEDASGLRSALESERTEVKSHKTRLAQFEGLDPVAAREALSNVEAMKNWTPEKKVQEKINDTEKQVTDKFTKQVDAEKQRAEKYRTNYQKTIRTNQLLEAIGKHDGVQEILIPVLERMTVVEEQPDGSMVTRVIDEKTGNIRLSQRTGATGNMEVEELVEALKTDIKSPYRVAFRAGVKSGSGQGRTDVGGGNAGSLRISASDARDPAKYRAAKAEAAKLGVPLEMV